MKTSSNKLTSVLIFLLCLFLPGCYETELREAYEKIHIGMNRKELNSIFKDFKIVKEQTVSKVGETTENEMRGIFFERLQVDGCFYPKDLLDKLSFEGDIKVFSYLLRKKEKRMGFATYYYVTVFYNQKLDSVIGKAIFSTFTDPENLGDKF